MLFPIGINQSHAQAIVSMTVVGQEFDFVANAEIGDTCLDAAALTATATGVTGTLGGLSIACFDGERTWQTFILNAAGDDEILQSSAPAAATGTSELHSIDFSDLMPATAYRAVLLLSGQYSADATSYSAASVYRVAEFTTLAATVGTPTAPNHEIEALIGSASTLTIPFSEFVPAVSGNTYDQLDITFRLGATSQGLFSSFTSFTGTTPTTLSAADAVLTVNADTVVITTTLPMGHSFALDFVYAVSNSAGVGSGNALITIVFVEPSDIVTANQYTITLPNLLTLPTIDLPISDTVITDTLLDGTTFGTDTIADVTFTTNATGNATGTMTVTNPSAAIDATADDPAVPAVPVPIFHYTPKMFGIIEAFSYTATLNGESSSSTLYIVVPAAASLELDFTQHTSLSGRSCFSGHTLDTQPTEISGTLGKLTNNPCFQNNEHTWQAFILNAGSDNTIIDSTDPVNTSDIADFHRVSFESLEPETGYRIVLLLTGTFSSLPSEQSSNPYIADTTVYRVTTQTTPALDAVPVAPDFAVQAIAGQTIVIPFSTHVSDSMDGYDDLDIFFSLRDESLYAQFTEYSGTRFSTPVSGDIKVNAGSVEIENSLAADYDTSTLIDYSVLNLRGFTSYGVITIDYVDLIGEVMANPYTVTLADLSDLPTVTRTIPVTDVASTILAGTQVAGTGLYEFTFSDIGTSDVVAGETATGSDSGTLVVTNPTSTSGTILAYTPASGFSGTETFDYTVSLQSKSDSSEFRFIVPAPAVPGTPIASDHTIEILRGDATARIITLPFSDIISDTTDAFADLIIIFSTPDDRDNSQFNSYVGTNATTVGTPVGANDVLRVISESVTLANDNGATHREDVVIEYTVTDPGGLSDSGTITIKFVNIVGNIVANTHTITLPDLFGLPTIVTEFDDTIVEDLILATTSGRFVIDVYTLTTTGTGNSSGTLVIVPTSVDTPGEFRYTPGDASVGNEGFPYTVTIDGKSATSEIIFNVPMLECEIDMIPRINFGSLGNGQQSDESLIDIMNDGNAANQVMIHGAKWLATDATNTETIMNENVTRWSTTSGGYDVKELLLLTDSGIAEVGKPLTETKTSMMVYLQLLIELKNTAFRGETTQAMSIGSDCST